MGEIQQNRRHPLGFRMPTVETTQQRGWTTRKGDQITRLMRSRLVACAMSWAMVVLVGHGSWENSIERNSMDPWATCVIVDHTVDYRTVHQTSLSRIYTRNYYFLQSEVSFRTRNQFQLVPEIFQSLRRFGAEKALTWERLQKLMTRICIKK